MLTAGTTKLLSLKHGEDKKILPRVTLRWSDTAGVDALNSADLFDINLNTLWNHAKYIVAQSQDQCKVGAWIYAHSPIPVSKIPAFIYSLFKIQLSH